jgi:molybdopterin synthase catalytic subunit
VITDEAIRPHEHFVGEFDPTCGGVVTFCGVVRTPNKGREVIGIFYDCYREMAEREIGSVVTAIKAECSVKSIKVLHRVGEVAVGEVSLLVAVSAEHRREAFAAAARVIDEIKRRLPIWKKERYDDGSAKWV